MLRRQVHLSEGTNFPENFTASFFIQPEEEGNKFLQNDVIYIQIYKAYFVGPEF
jgi:hypothetical protein